MPTPSELAWHSEVNTLPQRKTTFLTGNALQALGPQKLFNPCPSSSGHIFARPSQMQIACRVLPQIRLFTDHSQIKEISDGGRNRTRHPLPSRR